MSCGRRRWFHLLPVVPTLATLATVAVAADWEAVGTDEAGSRYSVDASRIQRDGDLAGVLVRTDYAKPRRVDGLDVDVFASLDRLWFDCGRASFALQSRTLVAADGTEIPRGATSRADLNYRPVAAGSMSEKIARQVCAARGAPDRGTK